jgi:hypothetical protein
MADTDSRFQSCQLISARTCAPTTALISPSSHDCLQGHDCEFIASKHLYITYVVAVEDDIRPECPNFLHSSRNSYQAKMFRD